MFADWAWQALLVTGICSVLLGITMAVWPDKTVTVAGTLCGLVLLATAGAQFVVAFGARIATPLRVMEFASGAAAVVLALWCFNSGQWVLLLALWIGMGWMTRGVVQAIVGAWSEEFDGAGRQEVVGLVTTAVGLVVAVGPFDSLTSLSVGVGLFVIALGASEIFTATRIERSAGAAVAA